MKLKISSIIIWAFFNTTIANSEQFCNDCERDQRGRIQRSASAKTEFKRQNPCPATGSPKGKCPGYVIDHIIALKRGGADSPDNMQWQTTEEAKAKDKWE